MCQQRSRGGLVPEVSESTHLVVRGTEGTFGRRVISGERLDERHRCGNERRAHLQSVLLEELGALPNELTALVDPSTHRMQNTHGPDRAGLGRRIAPGDLLDPLASTHHLVGRCRTVQTRAGVEPEALRLFVLRARLPGMFDGQLERAIGVGVSTPRELHVSEEPIRAGEPEVVPQVLQNGDHAAEGFQSLRGSMSGIRELLQQQRHDPHVRFESSVPALLHAIDRLGDHLLRSRDLPRLHQDLPQLGNEREPTRPSGRQEIMSARQEVRGRRHVTASQRTTADGGKGRAGAIDQRRGSLVGMAELGAIPGGLLEVIGQDLLVLPDPITGFTFEPAREAEVKIRA